MTFKHVASAPVLLTICALSLIGCGGSSPSKVASMSEVASKKDAEAMKEKMVIFLSEVRAGAKLLTLVASTQQVNEKSNQITDLYTHLPDIPVHLDPRGEVTERLKDINELFTVAVEYPELIARAERNGSEELIMRSTNDLKEIVNDIKKFADEIESKLGL